MTLTDADRQQALDISARAQSNFDQIRGDNTLSDVGKQRKMAPVYRDAKQQLDQLHAATKINTATRLRTLQRQTFGVNTSDPVAVMDYRNAVNHASSIDDASQAQFQMQRALMNGDASLAKALAQQAVDYGWTGVLDVYLTEHPEARTALQEINQLAAPPSVADSFHFATPKPTELARLHDHQIEQLADQG